MDLQESGRKIGEKLFALLSSNQKKELAQFVRDYETGNIPADVSYTPLFRGQYFIPPQADQPLTEIREGDLYWNYHYEKTRYKISNLLEDGKEASEKLFLGG